MQDETSRRYRFEPCFEKVAEIAPTRTIADLEKEIGVYSATPEFVRRNCGPIANELLDAVPGSYYDRCRALGLHPNCDIRIHRLYPGDFPAYPGWHCDGEYRETYFSQPDLNRIPVSYHLIGMVSSHPGGVSNTQFLTVPFDATVALPSGQDPMLTTEGQHTVWGQVDTQVRRQWPLPTHEAKDGEMWMFDARTLHRCMSATVRGWRLFFRMSMWHRPNLGEGGMITRQEQVYKLAEGSGW